MEEHIIQVGPNILTAAMSLIKIFLAKEIAMRILTASAVGGLTFGILELFMRPGLQFNYATAAMPEKTSNKFKIAILLVVASSIPLIAAIAPIFISNRETTPYVKTMEAIAIGAIISVILCWIISWALKSHIPREKRRHNHFLYMEALEIILETTKEYIAEWLMRISMMLINISIKIVHRPFILEYGIVAVILNLIISFILISIMGISKESGAANILGSLLGGGAHYLMRRKRINELRAQYVKEYDSNTAAHKENVDEDITEETDTNMEVPHEW